jgi:hypothetical protein
MTTNPMLNPAVIGRLCDAIRCGPVTPEVAQLVELSSILAAEHAAATVELAKLREPSPNRAGPDWQQRSDKPRRVVDVASEYEIEMRERAADPAKILAARVASAAATEAADVRPEAVAPPSFSGRLVPRTPSAEPVPPAVDAMKAHQDRQKEQARLRQQRKRERDRQKASREP